MRTFFYNQTLRLAASLLVLILMIMPFLEKEPLPAEAAWYNESWSYRKSITIDADQVSSTLTNFPVFVDLSDLTDLANFKSDGSDIRITKSDGTTEVPFELVSFNQAGDTGELHFKADSISSSTDTTFYIYYGNSGASAYAADATYGSENVWTNSQAGVWHSADDFTDSSGNVAEGSLVGDAAYTTGKIGQAMTFDGTGDYATAGTFAAVGTDNAAYTISTWVNVNTGEDDGNIIHISNGANGEGWCIPMIHADAGKFRLVSWIGGFPSTVAATGTYTKETWYHVVHRWDSSGGLRLYINGALDNSAAQASFDASGDGVAYIHPARSPGTCAENQGEFAGEVDEFRVYSRAISDAEIAAEYSNQNTPTTFYTIGSEEAGDFTNPSISFTAATPFDGASQSSTSLMTGLTTSDTSDHYAFLDLDDSLVGWWRGEGDATDDGPNGNNGTAFGDTTYTDGVFGQAFSFDGTGDYVSLANESQFDFERTDSFSVSMWLKPADTSVDIPIAKMDSDNGFRGWDFVTNFGSTTDPGKVAVQIWNSPSNRIDVRLASDSSLLNDGNWHHYLWTYDGSSSGSGVKIYEDGSLLATTVTTNTLTQTILNNEPVFIANRKDNGNAFKGGIDDVLIFSRELSADEVASLYDASADQYSQTHTGLSEGDHTITGYAVDASGNTANTGESTITIDATDPTISFSSTTPLDGSSQDSTSLVTGLTTADASSAHYSFLNLDDSLVGWWRAEDNANDSSGNGNGGTLQGDTTYAPGTFGRAFSFDGTGDYVATNFIPPTGADERTFSVWIYPTSTTDTSTDDNVFFHYGELFGTPGNRFSFSVEDVSGTDRIIFRHLGGYKYYGVVTLNTWNYIAIRVPADSSTTDDVEVSVNNGGFSPGTRGGGSNQSLQTTNKSLSIGARRQADGSTVSAYFNGRIDDMLVFSRALSADEVSSLYDASADQYSVTHTSLSEGDHTIQGYTVDGAGNTANTGERTITIDTTDPTISYGFGTPGDGSTQNTNSILAVLDTADNNSDHYSLLNLDDSLIGWWRGEGNATDESSNGNNGTLQGDTTYTSGQFGEAFEFDGDGDYVSLGNSVLKADLSGSSAATISAWINADSLIVGQDSSTILSGVFNATSNAVFLGLSDTGNVRVGGRSISSDPFQAAEGSDVLSTDTWYHVVAVIDLANDRLLSYVNGVEDLNTAVSFSLTSFDSGGTPSINDSIGGRPGDRQFNGSLDDIALFSRALTADEISSLYDAQATQYSETHTSLSEGDHTIEGHVVDKAGNLASASERTITIDTTAPTISEVTAVTTPTTDTTPDYIFTTNEAGGITYGGSCTSATTSASSGSNTITFATLSDGTYSDCTITVQDAAGNDSNELSVTSFTIDAGGPTAGGGGTLTISNITQTGAEVSWTKATDVVTAQGSLEYLLYYSSEDNVATVANAEANGTSVGSYTADIATQTITGLTAGTIYYVNVVVKDENDFKTEYTDQSFSTTSPQVTGGGGGSVAKTVSNTVKRVATTLTEIIPESFFRPVQPVANVIDSIADLFGGGEEDDDPEPIVVPEEAPLAFRGNLFLPERIVGNFVFSPLPDSFLALQQKFPEVGETFSNVGVTTVADVPRLAGLEFNIPRLGDVIERGLEGDLGAIAIEEGRLPGGDISSNSLASVIGIPVSELPARVIDTIPTDVVFARSADEKVDIGSELAIDANGDVNQVLEVISGQQLKLLVKPGEEVESITGFLTIDNRELAEAGEERSGVDLGSMVASAFLANPRLAKETNREVEREFVLETFAYNDEDADGVYEANVNMPLVKGQYAIKTRIVPADSNRPIREIEMITVIDPEGYIYEKIGNQELRLNDAMVSIWWKNGETGEFELWPAEEFQQVNPQVTDKSGEYSFLVPEGEYYLTVEVDEYEKFESDIFKVSFGRPVHMNIEMESDSFLKKVWRFIKNIF